MKLLTREEMEEAQAASDAGLDGITDGLQKMELLPVEARGPGGGQLTTPTFDDYTANSFDPDKLYPMATSHVVGQPCYQQLTPVQPQRQVGGKRPHGGFHGTEKYYKGTPNREPVENSEDSVLDQAAAMWEEYGLNGNQGPHANPSPPAPSVADPTATVDLLRLMEPASQKCDSFETFLQTNDVPVDQVNQLLQQPPLATAADPFLTHQLPPPRTLPPISSVGYSPYSDPASHVLSPGYTSSNVTSPVSASALSPPQSEHDFEEVFDVLASIQPTGPSKTPSPVNTLPSPGSPPTAPAMPCER